MTREDYIRTLIKSHGYTLKDFAKMIHMPYTTLLSILNGSIGGAAMDNVLKICQALNIRIEELNQLSGENGHVPDAPRSEDGIDSHLLELIRSLPTEKQVALKILLANR
ncbi:MAG: helix-turn-helix transcriptional regulator [Selenomonadaceae bacterium]|nr:helix-turn-helix transcriptional regulator [Selenomonadaceae bacterium]